MRPEELVQRVLYRDGMMLVLDKPSGVPVHRGPKGGESLEDHFEALRFGLPRSPALAHRLDRETSGCLVLGRHRKALAALGALFKAGRVGKTYWAVVEGEPEGEEGRIDLPLGRLDASRGWWMKADPQGQPATTLWRVLGRSPRSDGSPPRAWVALSPLTGRTHQLRVHCASAGWPILGDAIYGYADRSGSLPLHLHARAVSVPLSPRQAPVEVEAPVPLHMYAMLRRCGWTAPDLSTASP